MYILPSDLAWRVQYICFIFRNVLNLRVKWSSVTQLKVKPVIDKAHDNHKILCFRFALSLATKWLNVIHGKVTFVKLKQSTKIILVHQKAK